MYREGRLTQRKGIGWTDFNNKSVTTRTKTNQAYLDARQGERQQLRYYLKRLQIIMQKGCQRWKLEDICVLVQMAM